MRLKTFHAPTMTEAMQMVRDALGDEAIIVSTSEERGKGVQLIAAIEPAFEINHKGTAARDDHWLQYDEENDSEAIAEELTDTLLRHSASEEVIDKIVSCATVMGFEEVGIAMMASLEQLFTFAPLPMVRSKKPLIMVGAPGCGKTLAVAKMATRGVMGGLEIGVISTDTQRAGGYEQLQAFTNLLEIDLKKAATPRDLRMMVDDMSRACDQIVIDTAGLNPFNMEDVKNLARIIGALDARPVFVLPAGMDADEAGEMARVFATIGVQDILPTRVDIARRLGSLLTAAHQGNLRFSDVSNTPKVAQGLAPLSPKALSRLLMPRLFANNRQGDDSFAQSSSTVASQRKTGTRQ